MTTAARPTVAWRPHPGPQTRFSQLGSFEALYGGAAGGGKSDSIVAEALRYVHVPGYRALICRASYPELQELMDRAAELYPLLGGTWNEQKKRWNFPAGAKVTFAYIETFADACDHDGKQYHFLGFDELGKCKEERIWTRLLSRLRMPPDGVVLRARGSANPMGAGHAWLKRRFINACGRDGSKTARFELEPGVTVSRSFVPAKVTDNPTLMRRDPSYAARLNLLPELERRALRDGDWDVGEGAALPELSEINFLDSFEVKRYYTKFLAFDWGYAHPFSVGLYCVPRESHLVKLDTITGRGLSDQRIVEYVRAALETRGYAFSDFDYTVAGGDCWAKHQARVGDAPSTAERFGEMGWYLTRAHDGPGSRVANLSNARRYTAYRGLGENGTDAMPAFYFVDTPGNRACYDQMSSIVCNPERPEEPLKVNADASGLGGDDSWDETLYAMASRPYAAPEPQAHKDPWQPGHDQNALIPWTDQTIDHEIGGGGISTWGF